MVITREPLVMSLREAERLWWAHWNETEGYRADLGYQPDYSQFLRLDADGQFRYYAARQDGKLCGHLGYIVHTSRHTGQLTASEDFLYLLPQYRRGGNAMRLLRFAIADLTAQGVAEIGMSAKLSHPIDPLLRRAGFKEVARFYILKPQTTENSHVLRQPEPATAA